jgi:hypothetical protein
MVVLVVVVVLVVALRLKLRMELTLSLSLRLSAMTTPSFLHFVQTKVPKNKSNGNRKNSNNDKNPCVYRLPLNG